MLRDGVEVAALKLDEVAAAKGDEVVAPKGDKAVPAKVVKPFRSGVDGLIGSTLR